MRERFLDIVTTLARYMFEEGRGVEDEQAMLDELVADGYDPQDVREAFEWLDQAAAARGGRRLDWLGPDDSAARVLTATEALKISPDAYGFLVRLRQLGILGGAAVERILERAMAMEHDEIGLEEIKAVAAIVIFDRSPLEMRGRLFESAEERRDRVYH